MNTFCPESNLPEWLDESQDNVLENSEEKVQIVLYNDEENTFDFVIDSLKEICEHTQVQAEQCTWLVHFKGKCGVKTGTREELTPKCNQLLQRGLTAELVA